MLFTSHPKNPNEQTYLTGLKGLLVLESFLWVFLRTFTPATIDAADPLNNVNSPEYQVILRKVLSVLFWNENLLYSSFILLSARCITVPFIKNSTGAKIAGSYFRRGIRLLLPTAVSLAISYGIFSGIGYSYLTTFKHVTGNTIMEELYQIPNALVYFNSVFNVFWVTNGFGTQAAALAWPTQTLWIISVIFQQSYTVYMTMVMIPYTRNSWRVKALLLFILTAFWVQSWAWFTITGLLIADIVCNMSYKEKFGKGIPISGVKFRLPSWMPCVLLMATGLALQHIWVDWRPEYQNVLLEGHTGLYYTGGLNYDYDLHQPQARDENYLLLTGFMLLLEGSDILQFLLNNPVFRFLGRRSLSKSPSW